MRDLSNGQACWIRSEKSADLEALSKRLMRLLLFPTNCEKLR